MNKCNVFLSVRKVLFIYRPVYQSTRVLSQNYSKTDDNNSKWNIYNRTLIGTAVAGVLGYYAFGR